MMRGLIAAAVIGICAASGAWAQSGPSTREKAVELSPILDVAARTGRAEAVIEFAIPPQDPSAREQEAEVLDDAELEALDQRRAAAVRAGQDRILTDTFGGADRQATSRTSRHIARMRYAPRFTFKGSLDDLERLARHPSVVKIHPIRTYRLDLDSALKVVKVAPAHDIGWKGANTYIAVIDSGVDRDHVFFGGPDNSRVSASFEGCFSNGGEAGAESLCPNGKGEQTGRGAAAPACGELKDGCGHGTHVAGIAAGGRTSGSPLSGMAPEARIIAVQIGTRSKEGKKWVWRSRDDDIERALEHVRGLKLPSGTKLAAINMSLGDGQFNGACPNVYLGPIVKTMALRTAVVISAGNDGYRTSLADPGCIPEAVTVSASDDKDKIADFSNIDDGTDLVAPGTGIESSVPGGKFDSMQGTSMAAPIVAGAFAVIREALASDSTLTSSKIAAQLRATGVSIRDDRPATNKPVRPAGKVSKPRIDVQAALTALGAPALKLRFHGGTTVSNWPAGPKGGPFTPNQFQVQAVSTRGSHYFTITGLPAWLRATPGTAGLADAGGSQLVTLTLNEAAYALPVGSYTAAIQFVSSTAYASEVMYISLTVRDPPPANDNFENAMALSFGAGGTTSASGLTMNATLQSGEPRTTSALGKTVWFKITPTQSGVVSLNTTGSLFNTGLGLYRGSSLGSLTLLFQSNTAPGIGGDLMTFDVSTPNTYYVQLGSVSDTTGGLYKLGAQFAPRALVVTPSTNINASGHVGGPFTPATASYVLTNPGLQSEQVMVQDVPSWMTASPAGTLTIQPSSSATVTLSINASAKALPAGTHTATLKFRDMVTGAVFATRTVSLLVNGSGQDQLWVDNKSLNSSGPVGGPFSPKLENFGLYNLGTTDLTWSLSVSPEIASFVTPSQSPGTDFVLRPSDGWHDVVIAIDDRANTKPAGVYSGSVTFTNKTSGATFTRTIKLTVTSADVRASLELP